MPGMFDNYDNIYSNACQPCPPKPECKLDPCNPNKPYAQYDVKGNLIGYWWNYGDTINLEFNIDGEVVFTESDKDITQDNTENTIDLSQAGGYIPAEEFLKDKEIIVRIMNFRREIIAEQTYQGSTKIIFTIDKDLSQKMVKSNYYCSLTIQSKTLEHTIFSQNDCTLTVK